MSFTLQNTRDESVEVLDGLHDVIEYLEHDESDRHFMLSRTDGNGTFFFDKEDMIDIAAAALREGLWQDAYGAWSILDERGRVVRTGTRVEIKESGYQIPEPVMIPVVGHVSA